MLSIEYTSTSSLGGCVCLSERKTLDLPLLLRYWNMFPIYGPRTLSH